MIKRITTTDPVKKKVVMIGLYDDVLNTFTKRVNSEHFMVAFNGYGIQHHIYEKLLTKDARVIIIPKSKSYSLHSHIKDWELLGVSSSIGGGKQRFLSVQSMSKVNK